MLTLPHEYKRLIHEEQHVAVQSGMSGGHALMPERFPEVPAAGWSNPPATWSHLPRHTSPLFWTVSSMLELVQYCSTAAHSL